MDPEIAETDMMNDTDERVLVETQTQGRKTGITSLPPEILVSIFLLLDFRSIYAFSTTCRAFLQLMREFQVIEYTSLLESTGSSDNSAFVDGSPLCGMSVSERLKHLKMLEKGWRNLEVGWEEKIQVTHNSSGIYDLTGGIYLLGNEDRSSVHWVRLPDGPSADPEEKTKWNTIKLNERIIDLGLNVYEHDLLAVVTTHESPNYPSHAVLSLHLLSLSQSTSGHAVPHPSAHQPILYIHESPFFQPGIGIEIVGRHLVLTTSHPFNPFQPDDHLYVIEWKTGRVKMHLSASYHTYSSLVFLSEDVFLCPNTRKDCLDIWRIPGEGERAPVVPVRSLALPELTESHYISSLSCRGELNPVGSPSTTSTTAPSASATTSPSTTDSPTSTAKAKGKQKQQSPGPPGGLFSSRPFHSNPEDAIVIFNIRVQTFGIAGSMTFSMFLHRRTLLGLCPDVPDFAECVPDVPGVYGVLTGVGGGVGGDENEGEDGVGGDGEDEEDRMDVEEEDGDSDWESDNGSPSTSSFTVPSTSTSTSHPAIWIPASNPPPYQPPIQPQAQTQPQTHIPNLVNSLHPHFTHPPSARIAPHYENNHGPEPLPWEEWGGPEVTRWFVTEDVPTRWITTSAGQRAVICEPAGLGGFGSDGDGDGGAGIGVGDEEHDNLLAHGHDDGEEGWIVKVLDFCPVRVRREECLGRRREEEERRVRMERQAEAEREAERRMRVRKERVGGSEGEDGEDGEEEKEDRWMEDTAQQLRKNQQLVDAIKALVEAEGEIDTEVQRQMQEYLRAFTHSSSSSSSSSSSTSLPTRQRTPTTLLGALANSHPRVVTAPSHLTFTVFREPIESCLPYTVVETRRLPRFDGVLMDEERLVGLRTDEEDKVASVWVMGVGGSEVGEEGGASEK